MKRIDYKELVDEYNDGLINVLRGFRPKYEFLELWVPDTDHVNCITNLLDAATESGEAGLEIVIDNDLKSSFNLDSLVKEAGTFYRNIQVDEDGNSTTLKCTNDDLKTSGDNLGAADQDKTFLDYYGKGLEPFMKQRVHEGAPTDNDQLLNVKSVFKGGNLFCAINSENHMIKEAYYSGFTSDVDKALMECFCRLLVNVPVQDAAEHTVLELEYRLRDRSQKRKMDGMNLIFNFHPKFELPRELIRNILTRYKQDTGFQEKQNFYTRPATPTWRKMSPPEKVKKLDFAITSYIKGSGHAAVVVRNIEVQRGYRVFLTVEGVKSVWEKAEFMMKLEQHLRQNLDNTIEIYQEMTVDKNKNREFNMKERR